MSTNISEPNVTEDRMKLMRVTDLDYRARGNEVNVRLVGRDEDGDRSTHNVDGTRPSCWIQEEANIPEELDNVVRDVETGYETFDGVSVKKVTAHVPSQVRDIREEFENHWEADVPYVRRVSVDHDLTGYIKIPDKSSVHISEIESVDAEDSENIDPRVFIADIETMPPDGDWDNFVDNATEPILMITIYDTYEEEYISIARDPEGKIDGGKIRDELKEQWFDHDKFSHYASCDINLVTTTTEEELLRKFIDFVEEREPDLISGWNWVRFDHVYILNRLKKFSDVDTERLSCFGDVGGRQLERKISGLPGFDMMEAFCDQMTFGDWRSSSLDYVSNEELDVGKIEDISIGEEYDSDRSRLLAYNIIDVQLTVALDEKHGIHEFFYLLAELSNVQIYDTFSAMRLVDGFIMSRRGDNEILPSTEEKDLDSNAGGLVLKPSNGISEWVSVLDLKSLYPSAFITTNASTETITKNPNEADVVVPWMPEKENDVPGKEITEDNVQWDIQKGIGVSMDKEGIIPKYLKRLFQTRNGMKSTRNQFDPESAEYKVWDNRQNAVKVVMNSFYGVASNDYWRLSTPELGDTITAAARYVTWKGVQIAKDLGYNVRYGDTDSIMIELADPDEDVTPEEVTRRGEEIEEIINERTEQVADDFGIDDHPYLSDGGELHGTGRHCFTWEFEKLYRRFFQAGSKKRYSGLIYWKEGKWLVDPQNADPEDADLDVTGYESQRSDVPEITEEVQVEIMTRVLNGEEFDDVSDYIIDIIDSIENETIPLRRIAKPGAINKDLSEYPNREVPRACEFMNDHMGYDWGEGDDPWIYYVDSTPPMTDFTNVIALKWSEDPPDGYKLDYDKHIEKFIKDPIEGIINEAGWRFEELSTGKTTQSMEFGGTSDDSGSGFSSIETTSSPDLSSSSSNPFKDSDNDNDKEDGDNDNVLDW